MNQIVSRKEETRRRIVGTAGRLFLEKGVDRVGVDEIMRECGLTHGGFYVYFASKEALIGEAYAAALEDTSHQWESLARNLADDAMWNSFLSNYLSGDLTSADNPACAAAILGADVARRLHVNKASHIVPLEGSISTIARETGSDRSQAIAIFAALVGATVLAAQIGQDRELAAELLNASRSLILKSRSGA